MSNVFSRSRRSWPIAEASPTAIRFLLAVPFHAGKSSRAEPALDVNNKTELILGALVTLFFVVLILAVPLALLIIFRKVRGSKPTPSVDAAKPKSLLIEEKWQAWRRRRGELERRAGIEQAAADARSLMPMFVFSDDCDEWPSLSREEKRRRNQIENHNRWWHQDNKLRDAYFSVPDIELRKGLIAHYLETDELSREQIEARIVEAKAKVSEADLILAKARAHLAEANEQHRSAIERLNEEQEMLERPEEKQRSFSPEEAATGDRNDEWFNEYVWSIYPKPLEQKTCTRNVLAGVAIDAEAVRHS